MKTEESKGPRELRALLRKNGARLINTCQGPNQSVLEFWQTTNKGARGVLIAQVWPDGSTATFVDWPTGGTWKSLEACLDGLASTSVNAIVRNEVQS